MPTLESPAARTQRPEAGEFLPYYARYIERVPIGDVISTLANQMKETRSLLGGIPESRSGFRYAPGKWSINEVLGHVIDAERIFCTRALRFARNDKTPVPGFEQDDYVANANFDSQSIADLAAEYEAVRRATILFFSHLDEGAWTRRGTASNAEVTVRALAYIIAGHELHHIAILRERYTGNAQRGSA